MDFKSLAGGLLNGNKDLDLGNLVGGASVDTVSKAVSESNLGLDDISKIMTIFSELNGKVDFKPLKDMVVNKEITDTAAAANSIKSFLDVAKSSPEMLSAIASVLPKILEIVAKKQSNN